MDLRLKFLGIPTWLWLIGFVALNLAVAYFIGVGDEEPYCGALFGGRC